MGPSLFHENSNPSSFFQTMLSFDRVLPLARTSAILDHICGSNGPKTSQKRPFHGCWISTQIFNLTTTNAILKKLTTIMYLHKSVHQKALRSRNSGFWCIVYKFLDCIKNHHICHALLCVASLVKFLYKFYEKTAKMICCLQET